MMRLKLTVFWLFSFLCANAPDIALSATFVPSKTGTCRYILEGPVVQGDLDRLKKIAVRGTLFTSDDPDEMRGDPTATLCLNSPGGNFAEGLAIAKFVSEHGISTAIDDMQSCVSECAIIFMAGRTVGNEEDYTNRKLHIRGTLGFDRPSLTIPTTATSRSSATHLNNFADVTIDAVTSLLSLSNERGVFDSSPRMKPSLVQAMLETGRNSLLFVDTVDKTGRWNVDIFGYTAQTSVGEEEIYNACANFVAWQNDESNDDEYARAKKNTNGLEFSLVQTTPVSQPNLNDLQASYHVVPGKTGYVSVDCTVNVYKGADSQGVTVRLCANDEFLGITYGSCTSAEDASDIWINSISIFPASAKLIDLEKLVNKNKSVLPMDASEPQKFMNYDILGTDLNMTKKVTLEKCVTECRVSNLCAGASFDHWNNVCITKSRVSELLINPKSVAWIKSSTGPQLSTLPINVVVRKDRNFPDTPYKNDTLTSLKLCESECRHDTQCTAFSYSQKGSCSLFKHASEYTRSEGSTIGYKVQTP